MLAESARNLNCLRPNQHVALQKTKKATGPAACLAVLHCLKVRLQPNAPNFDTPQQATINSIWHMHKCLHICRYAWFTFVVHSHICRSIFAYLHICIFAYICSMHICRHAYLHHMFAESSKHKREGSDYHMQLLRTETNTPKREFGAWPASACTAGREPTALGQQHQDGFSESTNCRVSKNKKAVKYGNLQINNNIFTYGNMRNHEIM